MSCVRRGRRVALHGHVAPALLHGGEVERDIEYLVDMVGRHKVQCDTDRLVYLLKVALVVGGDDDRIGGDCIVCP